MSDSERNRLSQFIKPDWPAPANVSAATTLRLGGESTGVFDSWNLALHVGDNPDDVLANRARLYRELNLPHEPVWLNQVHKNNVVDAARVVDVADADGSFTCQSGVVCVVMTADCLPILLTDQDGEHVAAIHAGWRGLANGVIEAALTKISANPGQMMAWLGPAISQAAFEVGEEVRALFLKQNPIYAQAFRNNIENNKKWNADLYGLARLRLEKSGVSAVYGGQWCTYNDAQRFYSYRRSGETGRMATLIWKDPR